MQRISTRVKHKMETMGIRVLRAKQENDGTVRLTVPKGTPRMDGEIRRIPAEMMVGGYSKTKEWAYIRV